MMNSHTALRRSQLYRFLADAFLYPTDDWTLDSPTLDSILRDLGRASFQLDTFNSGLDVLQAEHRRAFGLSGSLCYETEYGLPHEFRQSQELADLAGFYRAFGFSVGGPVRERPDHLSTELEFMHILALKEAYAAESGLAEQAEVCVDAQRQFLQDHLGRWIGLFAERLAPTVPDGLYFGLTQLAVACVNADAERLGAHPEQPRLTEVRPTPLGPELSCESCAAVELME